MQPFSGPWDDFSIHRSERQLTLSGVESEHLQFALERSTHVFNRSSNKFELRNYLYIV